MELKKATLKDIASQAGVSLSTVHKALYNKPGISEKVKNEIVGIAESMGYKTNYIASSLKRKPMKFALVMPLPDLGPNRYYYQDIWKGMRLFQAEAAEFNIEFLDFGFSGPVDNLTKKLEEVYENHADEISGLITLAIEDPSFSEVIDQFIRKRTAVVFISSDLSKSERLCCIRTQDIMAGSLAAELISNFAANEGKVVVASGDMLISAHYMNVNGFEQYFSDQDSRMKIIRICHSSDTGALYRDVRRLLQSDPEIRALYSCTARNTPPICKAVLDTDLKGKVKVIGSDLFKENREMLLQGVLQAVIYKNPRRLGYLGCKTLFNYLVKNEIPMNGSIFIPPVVIMKSNLPYYEDGDAAVSAYREISLNGSPPYYE